MNPWRTLLRREFWEHRSLWLAPLLVGGFVILATLVGSASLRFNGRGRIDIDGWHPGVHFWYGPTMAAMALIVLMATVTLLGYLLDCLYGERKDRSILFWRSLPVSDRDAVLAKFALAMLVVPGYAWLVGVVTQLISTLIAYAFAIPSVASALSSWNAAEWLQLNLQLLLLLAVAVLWYAPVAAWLMLASAVARRSPLIYAVVPVLAAFVVEGVLLGASPVRDAVLRRLRPPDVLRHGADSARLDAAALLQDPQLWLGVLAAALLLVITIRVRRYRDDT